jgi:hypothetical protein
MSLKCPRTRLVWGNLSSVVGGVGGPMTLHGGVTLAVFVVRQSTSGEGDAEVDVDSACEDAAWRAC